MRDSVRTLRRRLHALIDKHGAPVQTTKRFQLLLGALRRANTRVELPQSAPLFVPWTRHPLALLGDFSQFRPAQGEVSVVPCPPAAAWTLHERHVYSDADAVDALNYGWEAVCHVFLLRPEMGLQALAREAAALARRGGGLHVSNRGGYHSELSFLDSLAAGEAAAAARSVRSAIASAVAVASGARGAEAEECAPSHSWVNVVTDGHYHGLHDHEGSVWSGVLYLRVPPSVGGASGALALRTASSAPGGAASWAAFAAMTPVEGALLVFPACAYQLLPALRLSLTVSATGLPHAVLPLEGAGTRISLSFNCGTAEE